ncbi:hypothetical protein BB559_005148 [Furculomyces boomerangus]|uniref:Arp2/3 complex 34 kDa subunit n=2 Tax=Harpellales TaxID=61421 RepID=A0A2T9XXD5_9FUNG|nr:hypothetical protein BB559_007412 [Furculomyces boomerangus]PVU88047.1 hypothetical protein BB559_005754 [Furculomyces boomerangus]PVU89317.1 hypothetical protein BB559_005148 [Furculomyces boomerangus]PVZ97723.1 hypothetical protein BB558_006307 [Smittium angustum]
MIILEPNSYALEECLLNRFRSKREIVDITLVDFDNVLYHVSTMDVDKRNELTISIKVNCFDELVGYGVHEILHREYGNYLSQQVENDYNVTLLLDLDNLQQDEAELAKKISYIKRNMMEAPFELAFKYFEQQNDQPGEVMKLSYREDEYMYIQASQDRVTVIFSTRFKEEMDRVFGRVFLQEFVDARRQSLISNAPQVLYSIKEAPLEIRNFPEQRQSNDFSHITFILFPRHFKDEETKEKTVSQIQLFRNYLHYHIKCSKAYIHSRLRNRVSEFLKVLNRAKPENLNPTEKKTASGRYFRQSKSSIA